ncbi:MAG: hypothetical protein GX638_16465 [Crenarchaeota archaeon]|nr:hypothetical protein [Thermoproteota archaeon]
MTEKIEAIFEYVTEHPAVLMIIGGLFFAFISIFTAPIDGETTSFLRSLSLWLIISGVALYLLLLGLRFIIRIFRKLFHMKITFD